MTTPFARRALLAGLTLAALSGAALAHHGWRSFDSARAYYIRGEIQEVRWGNPHTLVDLSVDATDLPEGFRARATPPGGDEATAAATLASARPYGGEQTRLRLVLAGPGWMARWGLERPLEPGEQIEVLGFLSAAEAEELRPVMFWLADGQGVWQQLTSLPTPPEPAPAD